ncbi:unnamed protein product [Phyllotreta striolata]|uniref:Peptidoglycan-recognition protein n=1 Tax=Phyllotreta striolata TaxID=444603 RepID=A0A9N9TNT3_PHYSR|nr:unnamed protein product [Phyllotreta striolata]
MSSAHKLITSFLLVLFDLLVATAIVWPAKCPEIVPKQRWDGRAALTVNYTIIPVEYVIVHHTVTNECITTNGCSSVVKSIQNFHMDELDFHDIGYNFLVGGDGKIYEGAGWHKVGAHTRGYNSKSLGLAFIGDFSKKYPPSAQTAAGLKFIECALDAGELRDDYKLLGAKQVSQTVSPGAYLYLQIKGWPNYASSP